MPRSDLVRLESRISAIQDFIHGGAPPLSQRQVGRDSVLRETPLLKR